MNTSVIKKQYSLLIPLFFILIVASDLFSTNNCAHAADPSETLLQDFVESAVPQNWAYHVLEILQSPVTGDELSDYGTGGTIISSIVSAFFAATMSLNLFTVSGDWKKAAPAMFGTFFLAAENVFNVLQPGTYRHFFHRIKNPRSLNGNAWINIAITILATGSGVIISVADADSAGVGLARWCDGVPETGGESQEYFNATQCSHLTNGVYSGCQFRTSGNVTEDNAYGDCENALYSIGNIVNGIPTAVVGATAMYGVFQFIWAQLYDMYLAGKSISSAASAGARMSATYLSASAQKAMEFKELLLETAKKSSELGVSTFEDLNALLTTPDKANSAYQYLAGQLRGTLGLDEGYQAIKYLKTAQPLSSTAEWGLAKGAGSILMLTGIAVVGISTLNDVFNSGKNNDYIEQNNFKVIPTTNGTYVVRFPDGNVVDPYDPNYKFNATYVNDFKNAMKSTDQAMGRSVMTYTAQSIMVGLAGVINPLITIFEISSIARHKLRGEQVPIYRYFVIGSLLAFPAPTVGFHFYANNLNGAEEPIKKVRAYRKVVGEESYYDSLMTPAQMIWVSKGLLAGVFTVGAALAWTKYYATGLNKIFGR